MNDSLRSSRCLSLLALVASASALACHPEPSGTVTADPGQGGESSASAAPQGEAVTFAAAGVPHGATITQIALDPRGEAALTLDAGGGLRFWAALDGSAEPLVVPIRDPRAMALARDGAGGFTLALLDAAGGARVVGVDGDGEMRALASLSPTDPLVALALVPAQGEGPARLVAIGADHVLRVHALDGAEVGRIDEHGLRMNELRVTVDDAGQARVFALATAVFEESEGRFATELVDIELGADGPRLGGVRQRLLVDSPPTRDNPSLSPDGRTVVILQRQRFGGGTWKVIAMQIDDGRTISLDTKIASGSQPRISVLPKGRVLLDDGTGMGHIADLVQRTVELVPLRSGQNVNHLASVSVGSTRAAPASSWLLVSTLGEGVGPGRYLGYEPINVMSVGVAPQGDRVVWGLGDRMVVEELGGGPIFEVPKSRGRASQFVDFVDADTLLVTDWSGSAELIRWADGEVVGAVDMGNSVQLVEFTGDGRGSGVLVARTNLWQNPTVIEVRERDFGALHLLPGATNLSGVWAPGAGGESLSDRWGAWTMDSASGLHRYELTRLEAGIDVTVPELGTPFSSGVPERLQVDGAGQLWWVRTDAGRPSLFVNAFDVALGRGEAGVSEDAARRVVLSPGFVVQMRPSPDGSRVALVQQRDPGQVLTVYDADSLEVLWALPVPSVLALDWSDDGGVLGVANSMGGGAAFGGADGEVVAARCGLAFGARQTPPMMLGVSEFQSVCSV